ncbi:helicase-related protein [Phocaeicola paurosaccharolyticus]|uniref:helicase-related protein n=1 Tax=Phocaeicola paurosaccharolyticus TaxID=732242 RepID=UPI0005571B80|nr:helicase-related protein [Phocaeicola paurosaccharolyticus]
MEFKTGTLVEFRSRPWVIQQSTDKDLLVIKPLGGTDAETIGLYKPLYGDELEEISSYNFRKPSSQDVGKYSYPGAARILYNACRLSFRDIAGPFQCLGKLSFEPRPYQMVPLILALKQQIIRLLISDDVGIGKTMESLLIAKELYDRHEISRFTIICLPHLCEQWQNEIRDKFGLEAEIIRSSTISRLEKRLRANQNVFHDIPFQIISIDYIKSSDRKPMFLQHCPEFIIVDEAHTCAKPKGANKSQQQRYSLLKDLSQTQRHIVLLTATPHSGNMEEFQSVIGLLNDKFSQYSLEDASQRKELSNYFIQRRRVDIKPYVGDDVIFPTRIQLDDKYALSDKYHSLLIKIIKYVKKGVQEAKKSSKNKQRYIYWDLLAVIRGVMSSPESGISMLQNKIAKRNEEDVAEEDTVNNIYQFNDQLKDSSNSDDIIPESYSESTSSEKNTFRSFIADLKDIIKNGQDSKAKKATDIASFILSEGKCPIIFCQYIQTAEYVKKYVEQSLKGNKKTKDVVVEVVTSKLADEERKIKIDELSKNPRHVLVCTDCLSEGVNLQNGFEAIIHYDLPWNPNRMEQRNGRIDRFGQTASEVMISTMYDDVNNPVDKTIMKVLYRKQNQIRKDLGIYIPIADNDSSIMESIMEQIIVFDTTDKYIQPTLFSDEEFASTVEEHERRLQRAIEIEKKSHTYFAHNTQAMDPTNLIDSLNEAKKVIGDTLDTRDFVIDELRNANVSIVDDKKALCYSFPLFDLPNSIRSYFMQAVDKKGIVRISFASPTPKGYMYIGRNHTFVEDLSRGVINDTINTGELAACRAMVMQTDAVKKATTVLLMRVRSVISETKHVENQMVGEEMMFFGYRGNVEDGDILNEDESRNLFINAKASGDEELSFQQMTYDKRLRWINDEEALRRHTDSLALDRASHLVNAFTQYRNYVACQQYQVVKPVLPMDVIAAYVYLPKL